VWIGRRSYGIYLWHWPVIVFMDPATGGELGRWPLLVLQIVVTLFATEVSFRLVETPVRRSTALPVRTVALWSSAAVAVGVAGIVWLVPPAGRDLVRSDAEFADLGELPDPSDATSTVAPPDDRGDASAPLSDDSRRLLLFGDSAAFTLAEQFELPPGEQWDVQAYVTVGCPITPGVVFDEGSSRPIPPDDTCGDDWVGQWPEFGRVLEPDVVVIMVGAWEVFDHDVDGTVARFPSEAWQATVRDAFADAVTAAATADVPVVVLDVPCMQSRPGSLVRADPDRVAAVNEAIRDVVDAQPAASDGVSIAAVSDVICPDGNRDLMVDGVPARYDGVHYTRAGAALVWPWLLDELDLLLDGPGPMPS
jgi:hypothetical protein